MLYMGGRLKYWEGKARFPPESEKEIEVFVDAGETENLEDSICSMRKWLGLGETVGQNKIRYCSEGRLRKRNGIGVRSCSTSSSECRGVGANVFLAGR
jgi:hypothetical protein